MCRYPRIRGSLTSGQRPLLKADSVVMVSSRLATGAAGPFVVKERRKSGCELIFPLPVNVSPEATP